MTSGSGYRENIAAIAMTQTILGRLIEDFDFLACPRCHDGGFTDDPEFVEAFRMIASGENLYCIYCGLEYPAWHYGDEYAEGDD